ncbi:MAG: DNA polymerase III subunit delta [Gammaproteobacteria bacterium]|nr:DNA polymerase III subunit delta [Gammaproteobacteria bacterium]MDE0251596.1 DNA polymerase III subunit delta [Gammaproteobacteria bacterium]MDE0403394.1 DNA polymerase III subunit delta [Gammaproteobacteria bacterium]
MQLSFQQFEEKLAKELSVMYFFTGTEEFLVEESISSVLKRAKKERFSELERFEITQQESWAEVLLALDSHSLFSEKKILIAQLSRNVFGKNVLNELLKWVETNDESTILILRGANWDYRLRRTEWYKFMVKHATVVVSESLSIQMAMKWITRMASEAGIRLNRDTCEELAILTEGNLAAARQEIERLGLSFMSENKTIEIDDMNRMNWSLCGAFDAINEATRGNTQRLMNQLEALKRGGIQPLMLVGAVASYLRQVHRMCRGETISTSYRREQDMNRLADRLGQRNVEDLLIECTHIDGEEKGLIRGDAWDAIESILLKIAGSQGAPLVEHSVSNLRVDYSN